MSLRSSLHCQPSTVGVFTDNILTNDQICEWIASMVSEFRYAREHGVFTNRTSEQHDSLLQPETSTSPPTLVVRCDYQGLNQASTSNKDDEHKQSSNLTVSQLGSLTVGQSPEEDGLRTTTKSSSEKKEHSQILSEVSSTHEKKDEQNPVVNSTMDAFISDSLIKASSRTVDGNSSDKDSMCWLDGSRTSDDKDGKSEVCQQQKGNEVKEGRVVAASRSSPTKESRKAGKIQTDRAGSSGSRQQNSTNVLDKRFQQTKPNHPAQSNTDGTPNFTILTDSQYDDISDVEEPSGLTARFRRVAQYEDVSEDENQDSGKRGGKMSSTPPVVSEACGKTLENVQIYDSPSTPTLDEMTDVHSPYSVETADESEHHLCIDRDLGGETNHFYEEFEFEESDEESDVEYEVVPVMMSDLNPEPVEEEPALGKVMQHDGDHENQIRQHGASSKQGCAPKPVPASAFSKMAIFDTPDDQEQAIRCGQVSFVALPCGSPESTSGEGEDSCPTEDSCSYSSGPECNYMTVSKELYKSISSAQRKTDHCVPKNREDVQMPLEDGIIDNLALDAEDDQFESERKKRSQTSENSKQNDESVVIILSDSDEEGRENYSMAMMASTATSVDCDRGSSRQERNSATPEVATLDKNQKSSRSRVSWQHSDDEDPTREVISVETEDSDDFSNTGVNILVPERKKQRTALSHPRRLSEADVTKNAPIIDRMIFKESKSGEPATLVRVPRDPRQGPHESMSMAKSSFTEREGIREQRDKPASIPTRTRVEAHRNLGRRIMSASPSPSSAMDHCFTPASSAPVQSMQVASHARRKVFRTWKDQHVPLRREKKHKRANAFRRRR